MASLLTVNCNNCGAPLSVADSAKFVTCAHCGTQLQVQHTGGAVYTEILGQIAEQTRDMAGDLDAIRLQNELERLDREWMLHREQYMVRSKHGQASIPTTGGSLVGGGVAILFGIIWTVIVAGSGAPGLMVLFGLAFIVLGLVSTISSVTKASQHTSAEQQYQAERRRILSELQTRERDERRVEPG